MLCNFIIIIIRISQYIKYISSIHHPSLYYFHMFSRNSEDLTITPQQMGLHSSNIDGMKIQTITLNDFPAQIKRGFLLAHIYWAINYKFVQNKQNQKFPMVVCQPNILPKSWMNPDGASRELLQHEYGHYLIACWCALQFQQTVNYQNSILFQGNTIQEFKNWCSQIFRKTMREFCALEKKYDEETAHYCNQQMQIEWERKIVANINGFCKASLQRQKLQRMNNNKPKEAIKLYSKNKKIETNQNQLLKIVKANYRIRGSTAKKVGLKQ